MRKADMKKRVFIFLAVLLILLIPARAFANAPVPDPLSGKITYTNVEPGSWVQVLTAGEDGVRHDAEESYEEAEKSSGSFSYRRSRDDKLIQIEVISPVGDFTLSNSLELVDYGNYEYDGKTNVLKESSGKGSAIIDSLSVILGALLYGIWIIASYVLTIIIEMIVGLFFKMKPYGRIALANLMTNVPMNIILILCDTLLGIGSDWLLYGLEILCVVIEFLYYKKKYTKKKPGTIFIYTLLSNILSFITGILLIYSLLV